MSNPDYTVKKEQDISSSFEIGQQMQEKLFISQTKKDSHTKSANKKPHKNDHATSDQNKIIDFQKFDWLYHLCLLNQVSFVCMLQWAQELIKLLNHQGKVQCQSLARLKLSFYGSMKTSLYLILKHSGDNMMNATIRNHEGSILLFKQIEEQNKINQINAFSRHYLESHPFVIYDQKGSQFQVSQLLKFKTSNHLIYIYKDNLFSQQTEIKQQHYSYNKIKDFHIYYSKKINKKSINLQNILQNLIAYEMEDYNRIHSIFGQSLIYYLPDRYSLLVNILRQQAQRAIHSGEIISIYTILEKGCEYLRNHVQKIQLNKNKHFPKKGSERTTCSFCKRRKPQVICDGCTITSGQQIFLCIGNCFFQYHILHQKCAFNPKTQICNNITFFDDKCQQMLDTVKETLQKGCDNDQISLFLQNSNAKIAEYLNSIVAQKLGSQNVEVKQEMSG